MPSSGSARAIAWDILQRVEEGAFADALLGRTLGSQRLDPRDQALATRIVYGTLAWQGYLDYLAARLARRPPQELEPPVRTLLRMGLFQICKLTRVPPFAVVDTSVELSKQHKRGAASGLVNAILRRAAREWTSIPLPPEEDAVAHLSVRLSHPRWLVERWIGEMGREQAEALLTADNEEAPTILRVNSLRTTPTAIIERLEASGYVAEPTRWSPVGVKITPGGLPTALPGHAEGHFSVQGEASQLIAYLTGAKSGDRILDACAAPGGKATALAELMHDSGAVEAVDVSETGALRIRAMASRLGISIVRVHVADATAWTPAPLDSGFDCALVDAPCTGLGTLRQHPEVRWRRTPADVVRAADLQRRILDHAATLVRPGGLLVYATCTLTSEENEGVVKSFLEQSPDFVAEDPRTVMPASARELVTADGFVRTWPHRHGLDGFFGARLKRRNGPAIVRA